MRNKKPKEKEIVAGPHCPWCRGASIQVDEAKDVGGIRRTFLCQDKKCNSKWSKTTLTSEREL